ncbi:MAG: site-2 protease family protein, partial [Planctomycetes bacterium]|nr:site-2 protease family protein [Planctomycetota bacterium]
RTILPLVLFILTCGSMYLVGGLTYMLAGMAVLVAHEMGHFLQAVRYGVPASLPYFIPLPIPPLGTMGALISMRGSVANRKQMFDIGLTGPIAGLLVALPICWIGVRDGVPAGVSVEQARRQGDVFNDPLAVQLMIRYLRPELPPDTVFNMNPYYMAGWMAMLITGLNMVPVSQLDGGHVAYALLGRKAHWLARGVIVVALAYMLVSRTFFFSLMLLLVVFVIGIDHPPTADDSVPIGFWRKVIGVASLAIPVFCLAPMPILFRTG